MPARPRREPPPVQHRYLHHCRPTAGDVVFKADSPAAGKVSIYNYGDLHRRRRDVPEGAQPGPQDRQHLRSRSDPVRCRRQPAQGAEEDRRRVLERCGASRSAVVHGSADRARPARPGGSRSTSCRRRARVPVEATLHRRGLDRLVGHLDDQRRRRSIRTACTSGWTTWPVAEGQRPGRPSGSARRRRARPPAPRPRSSRRGTATRCMPRTSRTTTKIYYWTTPLKECGDDRGAVCKDFGDWTTAWTRHHRLLTDRCGRSSTTLPGSEVRTPGAWHTAPRP